MEQSKIDDKELKKIFNEYMKIRMRLKKHNDPNRVDKSGRKPVIRTDEERKQMQRAYYQTVIKPKREREKALKPPRLTKSTEDKKEYNRQYYQTVIKPRLQQSRKDVESV